jgi:hypothetical protein
MGDRREIEPILRRLESIDLNSMKPDDQGDAESAIEALGTLKATEAVDPLIAALRPALDLGDGVYAIEAPGTLKATEAVDPLIASHAKTVPPNGRSSRGSAPTASEPRSTEPAAPLASPRSRPTTSGTGGSRSCTFSGVPWARIGEHVGQRDLAVTANVYSHVLADEAELDYANLLA